ncbi:hypothetical protein KP509_05G092800 [Ceratopteris richardii]|uniref:Uncharacterized protein n=1 Tax=Ceratopteris richardii TaxID=49495 RepID=A0A8T2UNX8_CERRI|nr:hypothetical protein KP509_05G092800 [Ceratopteris richardii]
MDGQFKNIWHILDQANHHTQKLLGSSWDLLAQDLIASTIPSQPHASTIYFPISLRDVSFPTSHLVVGLCYILHIIHKILPHTHTHTHIYSSVSSHSHYMEMDMYTCFQ